MSRGFPLIVLLGMAAFGLAEDVVPSNFTPRELESLRQRAAGGDNDARYTLGRACLRGERVPRNLPEARRWLEPAAQAGHPEAMGSFGFMLARGMGVEADPAEGFQLVKRAAEAGVVSAVLNQGIMTLRGQGTPADVKAGLALITQAAERGHVEAQVRLAEAYFLGEGGLVSKSEQAAAPWALKAAEAGHPWAQNLVGTLKEHGLGLPRDPEGAAGFYRLAAMQGDPKAQSSLGRMLFSGTGVPVDRIEALYWLQAGAAQGEVTARTFLAEVEIGFSPDERAAAEERLRESPPPKTGGTGPTRLGPGPPVPRVVTPDRAEGGDH